MSLTLEIISHQAKALGPDRVRTFGRDGGTIGRSLEADWSLPDRQRILSNRHASIDFRSGSYYIVDTSKNGVFVNDADEPVGHGKPQRLFPGDCVRVGDYEMKVAIANADDTYETLLSSSHIDPVDAAQLVDSPDPTGYDLVEAQVITGVGIEMFLEDDEVETLKPLSDRYRTGNTGSRIETPPPERKPATIAADPTRADARETLAAFFEGAGLDQPDLTEEQATRLMSELGEIMREMITGVIDCLRLRAMQKVQLKQTTTIIQPRENNRLKFSANFEEGFSRLFLDRSDQYTSAIQSVRDAFRDIEQHQRTLLTAVRSAVDDYLERLEPQNIEARASNGRAGSLINAANKRRYWELYKEVYSILATRPQGELPQPFVDTFASYYEENIAKSARKSGDDEEREGG